MISWLFPVKFALYSGVFYSSVYCILKASVSLCTVFSVPSVQWALYSRIYLLRPLFWWAKVHCALYSVGLWFTVHCILLGYGSLCIVFCWAMVHCALYSVGLWFTVHCILAGYGSLCIVFCWAMVHCALYSGGIVFPVHCILVSFVPVSTVHTVFWRVLQVLCVFLLTLFPCVLSPSILCFIVFCILVGSAQCCFLLDVVRFPLLHPLLLSVGLSIIYIFPGFFLTLLSTSVCSNFA